jgi:hypothetical protein
VNKIKGVGEVGNVATYKAGSRLLSIEQKSNFVYLI